MSEHKPEPTNNGGLVNFFSLPEKSDEAAYDERALGRLTMDFSLLHAVLEIFAWEVWKLKEPAGRILTKDLQITQLADKLRDSTPYAIADRDRKEFLAILKRIAKATEERNQLLHGLWYFEHGQPVICVSRKSGELSRRSLDEIKKFHEALLNIISDLLKFKKRNPLKGSVEQVLEEVGAKLVPKHPDLP